MAQSFAEWISGCVFHKQVYSMDGRRLGSVLVVCVRICATWLVCIQAWIYQRTSFCSSNLKLNQDSSELPSRLSI